MKKTFSVILALVGITFAEAASISSDDYLYTNSTLTVTDASTFMDGGNFAFMIDLGVPLTQAGKVEFKFSFGEGSGGVGAHVNFLVDTTTTSYIDYSTWQQYEAPNGIWSISGNGNLEMGALETTVSAEKLLFQVKDYVESTPKVILSYYGEDETLTEIASVEIKLSNVAGGESRLPSLSEINTASITMSAPSLDTSEEDQGINITTWQGDVTAEDIQKPTYLVPEPATATLSLLALAGLAVRRRRK